MRSWDDGIEGVQRDIAGSDKSHIGVLAGPGTGKTFGLQRRVVRLLSEGVVPQRILAVTFTRAAARSLEADIRGLDATGSQGIHTGTLHSLAFSVLRRTRTIEATGRHPRPLAEFELEPLYADLPDSFAGQNYSGKRRKREALNAFGAAWATAQSQDPGWPMAQHEREFHHALESWLRFHRSMLIGEVVPMALSYMRNNPDVAPSYAHVLVDEYQDLNRAEQLLIDQLARNGAQLAIGDDDQSIYGFKYAHPEGIVEFVPQHTDAIPFETNDCRRCPPLVVSMANALMTHQVGRLTTRELTCHDPEKPQDVEVVRWPDTASEATGIARFISAYLQKHHEEGIAGGSVVVLAPRRQLGYLVRDALRDLGIPSHSFFREQELDADSAKTGYVLLRLLGTPDDRVAIRWWLGFGSSTWLKGAYKQLRDYCESSGQEPRAVLGQLAAGEMKLRGSGRLVERWRDLNQTLARFRGLAGPGLIDALFPEDDAGCLGMRTLAEQVVTPEMEPGDVFEAISNAVQNPEIPEDSPFVRVMSLHKSKGLTADVVVVVGLVEGLMPFLRDGSEMQRAADLAEQRRLFYVAITRTRRCLILSSPRRIRSDLAYRMNMRSVPSGAFFSSTASSFIDEVVPPGPRPISGDDLARKYPACDPASA